MRVSIGDALCFSCLAMPVTTMRVSFVGLGFSQFRNQDQDELKFSGKKRNEKHIQILIVESFQTALMRASPPSALRMELDAAACRKRA